MNKACPRCGSEGSIECFYQYWVSCNSRDRCFTGMMSTTETRAWDNWNQRSGIKEVVRYYLQGFPYFYKTEKEFIAEYYPFF